jgi:hypothetical protein
MIDRDDAVRRLASEAPEVARTYAMLVSKDRMDQTLAYADLSASMKAAMWSHQLLTAIVEHPEFTDEQRAIIGDALDLFTPEMFEITEGHPEFRTRVHEPISDIERRAKASFPRETAFRLFAHLGPV